MSDILEEIPVKTLNTIECRAKRKRLQDVRLMTCTVFGYDEPSRTIDDVVSVDGSIAVLASYKPDTLYIKTSPYIGMKARVIVRERLSMKGKELTVSVV